jgi:hypothetical protein
MQQAAAPWGAEQQQGADERTKYISKYISKYALHDGAHDNAEVDRALWERRQRHPGRRKKNSKRERQARQLTRQGAEEKSKHISKCADGANVVISTAAGYTLQYTSKPLQKNCRPVAA